MLNKLLLIIITTGISNAGFLSRDPLANKFPYQSPYVFAGNNPIKSIDFNGLYELDTKALQYEQFTAMMTVIKDVVIENDFIIKNMLINSGLELNQKLNGQSSTDIIKEHLTFGTGPLIVVREDYGPIYKEAADAKFQPLLGRVNGYENKININENVLKELENSSDEERAIFAFAVMATVLHEDVHVLFKLEEKILGNVNHPTDMSKTDYILNNTEEGHKFEIETFGAKLKLLEGLYLEDKEAFVKTVKAQYSTNPETEKIVNDLIERMDEISKDE